MAILVLKTTSWPRIKKSVQKVAEELQKLHLRPFSNSIFRKNQASYHITP
jgi:hypothetical protein